MALGRMILPSARCSMTWAVQPVTRDIEAELDQANDGLDAIGRTAVDETQ